MTAILADLQISVASQQYVRVPISEATGADPTGDSVYMAFPVTGTDPVTFFTGSWMTIGGIYYARCLVGPGSSAVLPVGFYDCCCAGFRFARTSGFAQRSAGGVLNAFQL